MRIGGYLLKDILNPKKWWSLIVGFILVKYSPTVGEHIFEQVYYRMLRCPQCVEAGKCIGTETCEGCNCHILEKMAVPSETCHCKRWGPIMEKEQWEQYKLNNNDLFQKLGM